MMWVRAACLLRPLGEGGKLQLAKDLGELQMVVGQGLFPLDALGPAHRSVWWWGVCVGGGGEGGGVCVWRGGGQLQLVVGQGTFPCGRTGPAHRRVWWCVCVGGGV